MASIEVKSCEKCEFYKGENFKQCPKCLTLLLTGEEKIKLEKEDIITKMETYMDIEHHNNTTKKLQAMGVINTHGEFTLPNFDITKSGYILLKPPNKLSFSNDFDENSPHQLAYFVKFDLSNHSLYCHLYEYFKKKIIQMIDAQQSQIKISTNPTIYIYDGFEQYFSDKNNSTKSDKMREFKKIMDKNYKNVKYFALHILFEYKSHKNQPNEDGKYIIHPGDTNNLYTINMLLSYSDIEELFPQLKNKNWFLEQFKNTFETFYKFELLLKYYKDYLSLRNS